MAYPIHKRFIEFLKIILFIYLAMPGLSCNIWDLQSSLQHTGSLVVICKLSCDMWDLVLQPGIKPWLRPLGVCSLSH